MFHKIYYVTTIYKIQKLQKNILCFIFHLGSEMIFTFLQCFVFSIRLTLTLAHTHKFSLSLVLSEVCIGTFTMRVTYV